jgi:hypothetical protein
MPSWSSPNPAWSLSAIGYLHVVPVVHEQVFRRSHSIVSRRREKNIFLILAAISEEKFSTWVAYFLNSVTQPFLYINYSSGSHIKASYNLHRKLGNNSKARHSRVEARLIYFVAFSLERFCLLLQAFLELKHPYRGRRTRLEACSFKCQLDGIWRNIAWRVAGSAGGNHT